AGAGAEPGLAVPGDVSLAVAALLLSFFELLLQQAGVQVGPQPRHLQHPEHGLGMADDWLPGQSRPRSDGLTLGFRDLRSFAGVHAAAVDAGDGPAVAWAAALAAFGAFPLVVVGAPEGSSAHGVGFACGVFAVQVGHGFLSGVVCGGVSVLSGARLPGSGAFV